MRHRHPLAAGLLLAAAIVSPAAASGVVRDSFTEELVEQYTCGVVITTTVHADAIVHLGDDDSWRWVQLRFRYDGEAVHPATGETIALRGRQIVTDEAGIIALRAQGMFLRLAGRGVVLHDVGRLVLDGATGATLAASARVIPFDDPDSAAQIDAAVCSLFD
jgi:hypothetical protein